MTDIRPLDAPVDDGAPRSQAAKEQASEVASTAAEQGRQTASAAAEAASQTAGTAAEGAKQVASGAAQQVTEVTRQASDQARQLVGQAQSELREQAATQTQRAAGGLSDVGRQIRALSDGDPGQAGVAANAARQLADKVEEMANRLEQRGFDGAVEDLTNFARRRPGMFLLSAAATGFVVGRLGRGVQAAKASEPGQGQTGQMGLTGQAGQAGQIAALPESQVPILPEPAFAPGTSEPYLAPPTLPEFQGGS